MRQIIIRVSTSSRQSGLGMASKRSGHLPGCRGTPYSIGRPPVSAINTARFSSLLDPFRRLSGVVVLFEVGDENVGTLPNERYGDRAADWSTGRDAVLYPGYRWIAGRVRRSEVAGTEQCRCPV